MPPERIMPILDHYQAVNYFERLKPHLSPSALKLSVRLLALMAADGTILAAAALAKLFPKETTANANTQLNRLLTAINTAAQAQQNPVRIQTTPNKKAGAAQRLVWLEAPHAPQLNAITQQQLAPYQPGIAQDEAPLVLLITFNQHETAAVRAHFWPAKATAPPKENRAGRDYNRLGLHGGMEIVHLISKQGVSEAQVSASEAIAAWAPQAIIALGIAFGVNANKQKMGDVLVSEFIRDYELARVNQNGTLSLRGPKSEASITLYDRFNHLNQMKLSDPAASVYWPALKFGTILSGNKLVDNLDYRNSLIMLETEAVGGEMEGVGVYFATRKKKIDWIVVKAICDWGDGNKNSPSKESDQKTAANNAALVVKAALDEGCLYDAAPAPATVKPVTIEEKQRPRAPGVRDMSMVDIEKIDPAQLLYDTCGDASGAKVEVLPYLLKWVDTADEPPLFALLGEYGMGKTVTCQRLAQALDARREQDASAPQPLYFDLRLLSGLARQVPTLRQTVEECMARGWASAKAHYSLDNVLEWMDSGAVVIFDGLDEALGKLGEGDGHVFTNNLLQLIRDASLRANSKGSIRLLVSCRTHYFKTLRAQNIHFTGLERAEVSASACRVLLLSPLSQLQVLRYLKEAMPQLDAGKLIEMIRSVHNLEELTHRPYTLKLVAQFVPEIERYPMAGRIVYGVTLYRSMAARWLERDSRRHHIKPEHKMRLAAHLAAHLWRSGSGVLPVEALENWFHAWLESQNEIKRRYAALPVDQLEEDLRTATFLTRQDEPDGQHSGFRFAHTSFQEFFLAQYLFDALIENQPECWAMKKPSSETLAFLGQMLAEDASGTALRVLYGWRTVYRPQVSELLLAYALQAEREGWPVPLLVGMDLQNAQLQGWDLTQGDMWDDSAMAAGTGLPPAWLNLSQANFSGADLRDARLAEVRLSKAEFADARLDRAIFLRCDLTAADWGKSVLTGTVFRYCRVQAAGFYGALLEQSQFLHCSTNEGRLALPELAGCVVVPGAGTELLAGSSQLQWLAGYAGAVWACAWSPDGKRFMSASHDGCMRLWDAASGEMQMLLHAEREIFCCDWSPDGQRLLSGSGDGQLRLWHAVSGQLQKCWHGHDGRISCCAWSPDGMRILSAGEDQCMRLWDAASGVELCVMSGYEDNISACAWSPNGALFASGSKDGNLCIWNAHNGTLKSMLSTSQNEILSCAWSPDGASLLAGDMNGDLRLWDADSGAAVVSLKADGIYVTTCGWSPDGASIYSAGGRDQICIWDAENLTQLLSSSDEQHGKICACACSPTGDWLLSGGFEGGLKLWDVKNRRETITLGDNAIKITCFSWLPDTHQLQSCDEYGCLRTWDTDRGAMQVMRNITPEPDGCISFSPDGMRLACVSGYKFQILNEHSEECLILASDQSPEFTCAWAPDGKRLASVGMHGEFVIWDAVSGKIHRTLETDHGGIEVCAWSPNGRYLLASDCVGQLLVWNVAKGQLLLTQEPEQGDITWCGWSRDGKHLLSGGEDGTLQIRSAITGELQITLDGQQGVLRACACSPDGSRIATAGDDGSILIWQAQTGALLQTIKGHQASINQCAWSSDGSRLASASDDGTVRIWHGPDSSALMVLAASEYGHCAYSPQGNKILHLQGDAWRTLALMAVDASGTLQRLSAELLLDTNQTLTGHPR
jgi:WD40 repeat protein/nucleoside phosphorylase